MVTEGAHRQPTEQTIINRIERAMAQLPTWASQQRVLSYVSSRIIEGAVPNCGPPKEDPRQGALRLSEAVSSYQQARERVEEAREGLPHG